MKEYIDLVMGLVAGLALTFLNNSSVHDSISYVFTLLDPTDFKFMFISSWISGFVFMISFIGIFVSIGYSFLILKKSLKR
ncbi:hypothetical protein [Clostridium sp.]|uniref:hypothetical protein n=1 Tax=Clostridium sp. TaxID=1506 RepID=UPI003F2D6B83